MTTQFDYPPINTTSTFSPVTTPPSKKKILLSAIKEGLKVLASIVAKVAIYLIFGLAMSLFYPPLAMPLYVFAATAAASKLVLLAVKAIDPYHISHLNELGKAADILTAKYPKLLLLTCIFTVAVSIISQNAGCAVAGILGVLSVFFIDAKNRDTQNLTLAEQHIMTY